MQQTLEQKADEMEMLTELGKKADKVTVIEQLAGKADKEDVQTELDKKVDKEEIEEILQQQIDSTNIVLELDKKADKETVAEELEKKANAEIMQEELNKKADAETVSDALALKADSETMQTELDKKADIATMTEELAKKSNISHTHNYAGSSTAGGVANSATKLNTARTIDGVPFDGSANIVHFGVCDTAADVAEKTVALTGFVLAEGARVAVYFANANTTNSPMLNINGTGAHYLAYRNGNWAKSGHWEAKDIIEFVYYSNHWIMLTANAHILTTPRTIRTNLGSTSSTNFDGSANITPGVTGTLPISHGGTGATSASAALSNLGGFSKNGGIINGNVEINSGNHFINNYKHLCVGYDNWVLNYLSVYTVTNIQGSIFTIKNNSSLSYALSNNNELVYFEKYGGDKPVTYKISSHISSSTECRITVDTTINKKTQSGNLGYIAFKKYNASNGGEHQSIISGRYNVYAGMYSNIFGGENSLYSNYSTTLGRSLVSIHDYETIIGKFNNPNPSGKFVIGKGSSNTARANCFRVTDTAVYATGNYNTTGADYAEYFEWEDGNPTNEDRRGLFVALHKDKISLANPNDDFIFGIISGNPSVIGDSHEDQWNGMYLYDIYGTPIMEEVEVPERKEIREIEKQPIYDEDGNEIEQEKEYEEIIVEEARTEIRQKLNPNYNNEQLYIPRSERKEWEVVGMLGKLVAIDDGSCEENGWCKVGQGGIATKSEQVTKYRVMKRLDQNHIKIFIL